MAKAVFRKFGTSSAGAPGAAVRTKRVWNVDDRRFVTFRTIDAHSKTLGQDLDYVFGRNVAKARRDNKAVTGVADRVPAKP